MLGYKYKYKYTYKYKYQYSLTPCSRCCWLQVLTPERLVDEDDFGRVPDDIISAGGRVLCGGYSDDCLSAEPLDDAESLDASTLPPVCTYVNHWTINTWSTRTTAIRKSRSFVTRCSRGQKGYWRVYIETCFYAIHFLFDLNSLVLHTPVTFLLDILFHN